MIPVNIAFQNYIIKNIESNELNEVLKCINESEENYRSLGRNKTIDFNEIEQRYLESLMNSMEYFCGIYLEDKIIGIIKGRIENKKINELWILSYLFIKCQRNRGNGATVLKALEYYFAHNYSIGKFCAVIVNNNSEGHKFWINNGYKISRIAKGVSSDSDSGIIMEKRG